jgi:hypothetical protein
LGEPLSPFSWAGVLGVSCGDGWPFAQWRRGLALCA